MFDALDELGHAGGAAGLAAKAEVVVGGGDLAGEVGERGVADGGGEFQRRQPGGAFDAAAVEDAEHALVEEGGVGGAGRAGKRAAETKVIAPTPEEVRAEASEQAEGNDGCEQVEAVAAEEPSGGGGFG